MKKSQNLTLFRVFPSQNIRTYSKIFIWANVPGYKLGIAKISLKKLNSFLSYPEKTRGGSQFEENSQGQLWYAWCGP